MKTQQFTTKQLSIMKALNHTEQMTSEEIFQKVETISFIQVVYHTLEELKNMGVLRSCTKKDITYHKLNII